MAITLDGTNGITGPATKEIVGTTTNDSAAAGYVGEYVSASVAYSSPVSLVTGTPKTITSISLTAGDWDVTGMWGMTGGASTTVLYGIGTISTTNNGVGSDQTLWSAYTVAAATTIYASTDPRMALIPQRVSIASTTTIYLVVYSGFNVSTNNAYGRLDARRVR
jgi:hypothetical protein